MEMENELEYKSPYDFGLLRKIAEELKWMKEEANSIFPMLTSKRQEEIIEKRKSDIQDLVYKEYDALLENNLNNDDNSSEEDFYADNLDDFCDDDLNEKNLARMAVLHVNTIYLAKVNSSRN